MNELQNTLETLRACLRMLTFCDLVSGLIVRMTKFGFDAGQSKVLGRHFLDRFFKFVSLLRLVRHVDKAPLPLRI